MGALQEEVEKWKGRYERECERHNGTIKKLEMLEDKWDVLQIDFGHVGIGQNGNIHKGRSKGGIDMALMAQELDKLDDEEMALMLAEVERNKKERPQDDEDSESENNSSYVSDSTSSVSQSVRSVKRSKSHILSKAGKQANNAACVIDKGQVDVSKSEFDSLRKKFRLLKFKYIDLKGQKAKVDKKLEHLASASVDAGIATVTQELDNMRKKHEREMAIKEREYRILRDKHLSSEGQPHKLAGSNIEKSSTTPSDTLRRDISTTDWELLATRAAAVAGATAAAMTMAMRDGGNNSSLRSFPDLSMNGDGTAASDGGMGSKGDGDISFKKMQIAQLNAELEKVPNDATQSKVGLQRHKIKVKNPFEMVLSQFDPNKEISSENQTLRTLSLNVTQGGGLLVHQVVENGAASLAGIVEGDLILKVEGFVCLSERDLELTLEKKVFGDYVNMLCVRADPQTKEIKTFSPNVLYAAR